MGSCKYPIKMIPKCQQRKTKTPMLIHLWYDTCITIIILRCRGDDGNKDGRCRQHVKTTPLLLLLLLLLFIEDDEGNIVRGMEYKRRRRFAQCVAPSPRHGGALLMMIRPQSIILVVRGVPSICTTDDDTYHTQFSTDIVYLQRTYHERNDMFFLPASHSQNRCTTGIYQHPTPPPTTNWIRKYVVNNGTYDSKDESQNKDNLLDATLQHKWNIIKSYIQSTMPNVTSSSSLREVLHSWWSVRKVPLVESFRGIPNANIQHALNEHKHSLSTKKTWWVPIIFPLLKQNCCATWKRPEKWIS